MALQTPPAVIPNPTAGWWPSRYGAEDEAGALNEITPGKVLEAVGLVRQGLVYDLAHVLHEDIPAFPGRTFRQYLTTNYHHINRRRPDAGPAGLGSNSVNWIVEQVTATQQMGTHMDGLNYLQVGDRTYNGFHLADIVEDHGTNRLGIDTLPQVVIRGLLLDVAAARGGERLPAGEVITVAGAEARWPSPGTPSGPATRCSSTPAGAACGEPTADPAARARSVTAAGLICAGLLSVLIFPLIALGLLRRDEPDPAAVPATAPPVPEPHLM